MRNILIVSIFLAGCGINTDEDMNVNYTDDAKDSMDVVDEIVVVNNGQPSIVLPYEPPPIDIDSGIPDAGRNDKDDKNDDDDREERHD